jgi:hypothetical protein
MKRLVRIAGWSVLLLFAIVNGVWAMRYLLPHPPFASPIPNARLHPVTLGIHAAGAAVALIIGPFQLINGFRVRWRVWHRRLGWIYCGAVLIGGPAALPLSLRASSGPVAQAGFMTLAVVWLIATSMAVRLAIQHRFEEHRRWMLRSYALTAAAITLRIYLPLAIALRLPPDASYRAIAWMCWVLNLAAVEIYLLTRSGSRHARRAWT